MTFYRDRLDAAERLIRDLPEVIDSTWLVLGLPRGGVPIAAAIARHLGAELDLLAVRKVGAPGNPELAVAAITGPDVDQMFANDEICEMVGLSRDALVERAAAEGAGLAARRRDWTGGRAAVPLAGRDVLLVDDGAATGTTLAAAVRAAHGLGARRIAVAVPVALDGALHAVEGRADLVVCPLREARFHAVGFAYGDFPQVEDAEVARLIAGEGV